MKKVNKFILIIQPNLAIKGWLKEVAMKLLVMPKKIDELTLDELRQDSTVYIFDSVKNAEEVKAIIDKNFREMLEYELALRCSDAKLWPTDLTLTLFYKWFTPEFSLRTFII